MTSKEDIKKLFHSSNVQALSPEHDSTNFVFSVSSDEGSCIVKVPKCLDDDLSNTFWHGLNSLFGLNHQGSIKNLKFVSEFINKFGTIQVPKVLKADATSDNAIERPFVILEKMQGSSVFEGSELESQVMQNEDFAFQLGKHISALHRQKLNYFGSFENKKYALNEWPKKFHETMRLLGKSRQALQDKGVQRLLPHYLEEALKIKAPTSTSLIMLDCWPNQFLISQNCFTACIDIEAYVVGPMALELTLLELWIGDLSRFKEGYFSVNTPWPEEIEDNREVYRFFLFLLYGCPEKGLEACIYSNPKFPEGDRIQARIYTPRLRPPGYPGFR